jgi:hypothetical protein
MANLIKTFDQPGDFEAMYAAEAFLAAAGFSVGSTQRGDPRGIMFGDYDIAKWRNLNGREREALHGTMTGNMREGPVTVRIFEKAPEDAKRRFYLHVLNSSVK